MTTAISSIYVLGASTDEDSYFCHHLAKRIAKVLEKTGVIVDIEFELCLEVDFNRKIEALRLSLGGSLYTHTETNLVMVNGKKYIGAAMAMIKFAKNIYGIEDAEIANNIVFNRLCKDETSRLITSMGHPCAFLSFSEDPLTVVGRDPVEYGKIVIEL